MGDDPAATPSIPQLHRRRGAVRGSITRLGTRLRDLEGTMIIDTIGHAQGIGNKMIVLYTPCPFLWFLINFLRRKIVLWMFSDRCSDFSSSCCSL